MTPRSAVALELYVTAARRRAVLTLGEAGRVRVRSMSDRGLKKSHRSMISGFCLIVLFAFRQWIVAEITRGSIDP